MKWPVVSRARYERDLDYATKVAERAWRFSETLRESAYLRNAQSKHFADWASGVSRLIDGQVQKLWESRS